MNVLIRLSKADEKALRRYLIDTSHDVLPVITKEDICQLVRGMVEGEMQAGAVGDYVMRERNNAL